MELTVQYIISQIFTIISYIFIAVTYQVKCRKSIFMFDCVSQTAFLIAYSCLEAWAGVAMTVVALIRNIIFIIDEKNNGTRENINKLDILVIIVMCMISIISTIFTYKNIFSLLPVVATITYTYGVCQKNIKTYKLLGIPVEILWTCYNISIKSIVGSILEFIMLVSCCIGYINEIKNKGKGEK